MSARFASSSVQTIVRRCASISSFLTGPAPFPVFLTNHGYNRPWIYAAVRRGYIACIYHATDPRYAIGDDSDAWVDVYPEYDFSVLARWAWAARAR